MKQTGPRTCTTHSARVCHDVVPAAALGCPHQGLKFRRNFAEIRRKISFSLLIGKKKFGIFRKISFENSKFKKFRPKVTEIRRNLPKFRNEISFPLNTGICNENEMVNPSGAYHRQFGR